MAFFTTLLAVLSIVSLSHQFQPTMIDAHIPAAMQSLYISQIRRTAIKIRSSMYEIQELIERVESVTGPLPEIEELYDRLQKTSMIRNKILKELEMELGDILRSAALCSDAYECPNITFQLGELQMRLMRLRIDTMHDHTSSILELFRDLANAST